MSLKLGDREISDFASLVSAYTSQHLASPTRSTVPLLAFWARPAARFHELSTRLGLVGSGAHQFCSEFPVAVQQGSGKPSFTDLMVLGESFAVAIEAKFTEPPYDTVQTWLGHPVSQNRQAVLAGWLKLIGDATGVKLNAAAVADSPYQLVHRTASASHPRASHRWVVYQLFSEERLTYYRNHLAKLSHALGGPSALRFGILVTPPEFSLEYISLKNRWASGERDLSHAVRKGLLSDGFFTFNRVEFAEVGVGISNLGVAG